MISLQEWRERAAPLNEDAPQGYNYDRAAGAAGFARPGSHHADQALATKLAQDLREPRQVH